MTESTTAGPPPDAQAGPDADATVRRFLEDLEAWARNLRLTDVVAREELERILRDLRQDEAFWTRARPAYDRGWDKIEKRLRDEKRPIRALISDEAYQKTLDAFEAFEPDPEAVRTFLRSPAIESMLGQILYTGIFEFMKKADLFGNLVNKLPVIGPIRKKLMAIVADELEPRLEGQVKGFLGGFSGLAVERMIGFVLSPDNREGFRKARRRLAEHMLGRPVNTLLPEPHMTVRAREDAWKAIRAAFLKDEKEAISWLFEDHGDVTLDTYWTPSRPAQDVVVRALGRFLGDSRGKPWKLARDGNS